jgi:hypothetical protein
MQQEGLTCYDQNQIFAEVAGVQTMTRLHYYTTDFSSIAQNAFSLGDFDA